MGTLGPADAKTIAEAAGVPYSTTVRKLREWTVDGQIRKIARGKDPAHFTLLDGIAPAGAVAGASAGDGTPPTAEPDTSTSADDIDPEPEIGLSNPPGMSDADGELGVADVEPVPQAPEAPSGQGGGDQPDPQPQPAEGESVADGGPEQPTTDGGGKVAAPIDTAGRLQPGVLKEAALKVLRAHPDKEFKVVEVCRLIERGFLAAGRGARKASSGAVANALNGYAASGEAVRTIDNPATFKAA
ncbi:hypothetical protein R8Z50_22855 [Longispora sp. K20-0274]|uniref:hypothetical protein n=1 Tax=Longispora sp. K20-0274 TaxID=3088255 RepID=UPI00399B8A52